MKPSIVGGGWCGMRVRDGLRDGPRPGRCAIGAALLMLLAGAALGSPANAQVPADQRGRFQKQVSWKGPA